MVGETVGAFAAGVVVGWVGRGMARDPRGELVQQVATGYRLAASARRFVTERVEWLEDVVAEGRARYEAERARATQATATAREDAAP